MEQIIKVSIHEYRRVLDELHAAEVKVARLEAKMASLSEADDIIHELVKRGMNLLSVIDNGIDNAGAFEWASVVSEFRATILSAQLTPTYLDFENKHLTQA